MTAPLTDHDFAMRVKSATAGQFEILSELGRGGMAAVFLARDSNLGRLVALKVMLPELSVVDGMVDRFMIEARTAAHLDHPHIVPVYASGQRDGLMYFAMKYVDGISLEQLLGRAGQLDVATVRFLVTRLAEALQYAHDHGVTHRDIKPANVMIDQQGTPLLTDFGIARVASTPRLTQHGLVIGTPAYMSPEQLRGEDSGAASDQYSLGILIYQLLAGAPPFTGSAFEVASGHIGSVPPSLSVVRPDCPAVLDRAVMRMLEKNASARWPSLDAFVDTVLDGSAPETTGTRRRFMAMMRDSGSASNESPANTEPATPAPTSEPTVTEPTATKPTATKPTATKPWLRAFRAATTYRVASRFSAAFLLLGSFGGGVKATPLSETSCAARPDGCAPAPDPLPEPAAPNVSPPTPVDRPRISFKVDSIRMVVGATMSPLASARSLGDTTSRSAWSSDRPGLASVSGGGLVTARSVGGPVTIRVIQGPDTAALRVWVDPKPVARIRLRAPELATAGDTVVIVALAVDTDDGEVPNVRVRLSVNDTSVATLGSDGTVVAKTPGVAIITASTGSISSRIRLTVVPRALGGSRVAADAGEIAAAVSAQDTVRLGRTYPVAGADTRRQAFFRWVRDARRLDARLASMGAVIATTATTARVEFALDLRWKTAFHRPQKRVAFLAEYVYENGWRLTSLQPTSALPD